MGCFLSHCWNVCTCTKCGKWRDSDYIWKGCMCVVCGKNSIWDTHGTGANVRGAGIPVTSITAGPDVAAHYKIVHDRFGMLQVFFLNGQLIFSHGGREMQEAITQWLEKNAKH